MKQFLLLILFFLFTYFAVRSKTISGTLLSMSGQKVHLKGFKGFDTYLISSSKIADDGIFLLLYSSVDHGMGKLGEDIFIIVLSGMDIKLKGDALNALETIEILKETKTC